MAECPQDQGAQLVPVGLPSSSGPGGGHRSDQSQKKKKKGRREREGERKGEKNPLVPDILFRMPIKDNVTCKICKLLLSLWRPPGPHAPLPPQASLSCPLAKDTTLGNLRVQALMAPGTLGLGDSPLLPSSSAPPFLALGSAGRLLPGQGVGMCWDRSPLSLWQVSHPRGSVLMNLSPSSLFAAPGNSHTGGRHPRKMGIRRPGF